MLPLVGQQEIDDLVPLEVTALHERGVGAQVEERLGRISQVTGSLDRQPGQDTRLMKVGRHDGGHREEHLADGVLGTVVEQPVSARRDHHRIEHVVGQSKLVDCASHGLHQGGTREHAGLDRVRRKVRRDRPDLLQDHHFRNGVHGDDPRCVLSGHRRDRTTAENAERVERLEVRLDAGPAPAVAACDCEGYGRWVIHGVHTLIGMCMLSKSRRQLIERLKTRKGRPREGLVLVEGVRSSAEALAAGADIRFVVRSPRLLGSEAGRALAATLTERGCDASEVENAELAELSDTEHPQGVLCVCREPGLDLAQLGRRSPSKLLLLDGLQDPGNLGTLVRAARAFGVEAVVVLDGSVDPGNPKAVRAAAGSGFHTHIARAPWVDVGPWLEKQRIEILAADPSGEDVHSFQPGGSWALAVGNEGVGVRAEIAAASTRRIAIPMPGGTNSLNAGVAGSILLYSLLTR